MSASASRRVAAAPTPNPDAELLRACREFMAITARLAGDITDDEMSAAWVPYYEELARITAARARTPAGVRAKAEAAHAAMLSVLEDHQREELAGLSALADAAGRA